VKLKRRKNQYALRSREERRGERVASLTGVSPCFSWGLPNGPGGERGREYKGRRGNGKSTDTKKTKPGVWKAARYQKVITHTLRGRDDRQRLQGRPERRGGKDANTVGRRLKGKQTALIDPRMDGSWARPRPPHGTRRKRDKGGLQHGHDVEREDGGRGKFCQGATNRGNRHVTKNFCRHGSWARRAK